jgi:DNA-binding winged helix-turn-helix (wHTH) protein
MNIDLNSVIALANEQKLLLVVFACFVVLAFLSVFIRSPFSLYKARGRLLTRTETKSYWTILPFVRNQGYELMAQVRIADVISVSGGGSPKKSKRWWNAFKKISSKHVDFVVVNARDGFKIVCAIEIDDSSHNKKDRIERDKFINKAFQAAGVPLLRCAPGHEKGLEQEIARCV